MELLLHFPAEYDEAADTTHVRQADIGNSGAIKEPTGSSVNRQAMHGGDKRIASKKTKTQFC